MHQVSAFTILLTLSATVTAQTVTNTNDSGAGSLRQAIITANGNPGADTIIMQAGLTGTINLSSSLPAITDPLTIDGDSDNNNCTKEIIISGGDSVRIMTISDVSVTIQDITLRDGSAGVNDEGGAIDFNATSLTPLLTLTRACFISNQAGDGGAIAMNGGDLNVTECVFDQNTTLNGVVGSEQGGAIEYDTAINGAVTLDFTDSTFSNNTAQGAGGALKLTGFVTTYNFTRCHFTGNQNTTQFGGGAIATTENAGDNFDVDINIDGCQFDNNTGVAGGALRLEVGGTGPLTIVIDDSTFHSNVGTVDGGAMTVNGGGGANKTVTIRNTTLSGNSAGAGSGGGNSAFAGACTICNTNLTLDSCSFMNNTGLGSNTFGAGVIGGVDIFGGNLSLTNTIFADNTGVSTGSQDAEAIRHSGSGTFTDGDHNLIDDTLDLELGGLTGANNIIGTHPNLAALSDSPVSIGAHATRIQMQVRYPNAGSMVLNNGGTSLGLDQIGNGRPGGASDDIGAIEGLNNFVPRVTTFAHACGTGGSTLAYSGIPQFGQLSTFTLSGATGVPAIYFSLGLINDSSTCTGCTLGPDYSSPTYNAVFGTVLNVTVPCNAVFVNLPLRVQGLDIFPPTTPGCTQYPLDLTDTIEARIGL